MKITTTPLENHQVEMLVEAEESQLEGAKRRAARKISEKAKIPGFRPGKAPYEVVLRTYGDAAITEEAIELLVDDIYPKALDEAKIEPASSGSLADVPNMTPPTFKFIVPLKPEVQLGEYRAVRKEYAWQAPSDVEVEDAVADLRRMYGRTETVEREAQAGDFLLVDVIGRADKAKEEDASLVERKGYAVVAREEERESDWPFTGFSKKLFGLKPGETATVSHKFGKEEGDEELRGKKVTFEVALKTVRSPILPDLNDEFAQQTGLGQTVDEFRARMRQNLEDESRDKYDDEYFAEVIEQIKNGAVIKYPPQVLDHETEHVIEDLKRRLSQQSMDFDTYLKMREMTLEQFSADEARPVAQKRLERGLIMDEITRAEKIELSEEELGVEFQQSWASLAAYDPEFSKLTKGGTRGSKQLVDAVAMDVANRLMTRRALARIKEIATGVAESLPTTTDEAPVEEAPKAKRKSKKAEKAE